MSKAFPWKLIWNQVASEEWQAGNGARYYSIMQHGARFTVTLCSGEWRVRQIASADSLAAAQDAALLHNHHRTEEARA